MTPSQKSEQIADIQAGIDEADRGEFATAAEVIATIQKYTKRKNNGQPPRRPERSEGPRACSKERRLK
jgi:hypothetical protein